MKHIFLIFFCFFFVKISAQVNYEVATLDSFITTTASQGVYGLTAVEYDGAIHLAYYYGSEEEIWSLIYEVRNNGQTLSRETVHEFASPVWVGGNTAIQFDVQGHPHIFCSYVSGTTKMTAFYKIDQWTSVDLDYKAMNTWVSASLDGSQELGMVSMQTGNASNNFLPIIDYISYENGGWNQFTVTASPYYKTLPVVLNHNNETYVAYVEGHHPDTTILFVHKKSGGTWSLDLKEVYPEGGYAGGGLNGHLLWNRLGAFNDEVHILHNMDKSTGGAPLSHLIREGESWQEVDFENREDYAGGLLSSSKLEFDAHGNLFWPDGSQAVRWISAGDEYFEFNPPLEGNYYGYMDYVIKDGEIYSYVIAGDKNYPYGDPVIFYETRGTLPTTTSVTELESTPLGMAVITPNPGYGKYQLHLTAESQTKIWVEWVDVSGKSLIQPQPYLIHSGDNIVNLDGANLPSGLYYVKVVLEQKMVTIPVVRL